LGPAFEVASGIASHQAVQEVRKNPQKLHDFQLNPLSQWLHLIGFGISMLYPLCFTLFLRACAVCLRARTHVIIVNLFLVFAVLVAAATGYFFYLHPPGGPAMPVVPALALGGAWGVVVLGYASLIAIMRVCIGNVMSGVKSPLDM